MKNNKKSLIPILILCLFLSGCSYEIPFLDQIAEKIMAISADEEASESGDHEAAAEIVDQESDPEEEESLSNAYGYQHISEEAQKCYREILSCMENFEESREVTTLDQSVLKTAYLTLMSDRADLFYVNSYSYVEYTNAKNEVISLEFKPNYTMSQSEKEAYQKSIDEIVENTYLSEMTEDMSDYDKALKVFETMIVNVSYQADAEQDQNIISTFIYGQTVCQGYASGYQYLMNKLGIPSFIVTGRASGSSHAWNMIYLDGNWYCVDVTWGNANYSSDASGEENEAEEDTENNYVNYVYFAMTRDLLDQTHTADMPYVLPDTPSNEDSYYIHEGLYFTELDGGAMGSILSKAYQEHSMCSFMLADEALYNEVLEFYITNQHITECCQGISEVKYIQDEKNYVLIFNFCQE